MIETPWIAASHLSVGATGRSGLAALVPRHSRQDHAHPARIRDPGEHQTGPHENRQPDECRMNEPAKCGPQQHQRSRRNAHLTLQRDGLLASDDRKTSLNARHRTALDVDHVQETRLQKLFASLLASATGTTDDVKRFVGGTVSSLHQGLGIELIERDVSSDFKVDLPIFNGRSHVDEVDLLAVLAEFYKLLRLDDVHGNSLSSLRFRPVIWPTICG